MTVPFELSALRDRIRLSIYFIMGKVGINWQVGSGFGWGVFGLNLSLELLRTWKSTPIWFEPNGDLNLNAADSVMIKKCLNGCQFLEQQKKADPLNLPVVDFPVFYAGGNHFQHNIQVLSNRERRSIIFFENTFFDSKMKEASKFFTRIYAGSRWNAEILQEKGFERVVPWAQGVDLDLFKMKGDVMPRTDKFRIYSGGKLEYRKGQDITIEAFKVFHKRYPDSELVLAWNSPWPFIAMSMARSKYVKAPALDLNQQFNMSHWLLSEGLKKGSFIDAGSLPNHRMSELMRSCDIGLFPNRAEGGTNLVAMEAIACGLPTILSNNTGHKDLVADFPCLPLEKQSLVAPMNDQEGTQGWGESSVDEVVEKLEYAYQNRSDIKSMGEDAAEKIKLWSWFNKISELVHDLDL